jgi:hypothetical protein
MTITYRGNGAWGTGKGGPLTSAEFDTNTFTLKSLIDALVAEPPGAVVPTNVSALGSQITFTFSDASEFTVTVPTATTPVPPPGITVTDLAYLPPLTAANRYIRCTVGTAVTLPTDAAVAFPLWTELHFVQAGANAVTFVEDGVSINKRAGFARSTAGTSCVATLKKVAANEWDLFGALLQE